MRPDCGNKVGNCSWGVTSTLPSPVFFHFFTPKKSNRDKGTTKNGAATHKSPLRGPLDLVPFTGKDPRKGWRTPLKNIKYSEQRDEETGYSYFAARHYDPEISGLFLSVDPMADKYAGISPYAYCAWNPVRLVDPCGDSIRNAYESYKDIHEDVSYFESLIQSTTDKSLVNAYRGEINELKEKHAKYNKVNDLLSAYKINNETEYNRIDNIAFGGENIDVYVSLDNASRNPVTNAVGETEIRYRLDKGSVAGIENQQIRITLFGDAFNDGFNGIGTLANEFGDVIFGLLRPNYNYITNNQNTSYIDKPTTKFSFDYEQFITSGGVALMPNPYNY